MSGLKDIAVKVVDDPGAANAHAVLREVETLLARLLDSGEGGAIDVHGLPMGAADYEMLARELGEGEVSATIDAGGASVVRETAYAGVWWVTHRNDEGAVVAEFIEVARVPEILQSQPEDMRLASARLHARLSASA